MGRGHRIKIICNFEFENINTARCSLSHRNTKIYEPSHERCQIIFSGTTYYNCHIHTTIHFSVSSRSPVACSLEFQLWCVKILSWGCQNHRFKRYSWQLIMRNNGIVKVDTVVMSGPPPSPQYADGVMNGSARWDYAVFASYIDWTWRLFMNRLGQFWFIIIGRERKLKFTREK